VSQCGPTFLMLEIQSTVHRPHIVSLSFVSTYGYLWVRNMLWLGCYSNHVGCKYYCVILPTLLSLQAVEPIPLMGINKTVTKLLSCTWRALFKTISIDSIKDLYYTSFYCMRVCRVQKIYQCSTWGLHTCSLLQWIGIIWLRVGFSDAPQILDFTNSTHFYTHANLTCEYWISGCSSQT
jgi:hypothetical protein